MEVINHLLNYQDLKIIQDTEMFSFSLDSVLLPNFIKINSKITNILDIGCGNAPIPLILSTKTKAKITGIEIQKKVFELAVKSVKLNNLENQIEIINGDIKEIAKTIETDTYDIITCNPPFFKYTETSNINESEYKIIARHEKTLKLEDILQIARKILKNNGIIGIVHRPERLIEIIELMRINNLEPKRIQFVHPKKGEEANIVLIAASKNGKPGIKVLDPIYAHDANGEYTNEVKKCFE